MIEARALAWWDGAVGSTVLIAITVLALCVIMRATKLEDIPLIISAIMGIAILLIMLPTVIVSLWNTMSFGQHLGIVMIIIAVLALFRGRHGKPKRKMTVRKPIIRRSPSRTRA